MYVSCEHSFVVAIYASHICNLEHFLLCNLAFGHYTSHTHTHTHTLLATGTKKLEGLVQEMDGLDSSWVFGLPCLAS